MLTQLSLANKLLLDWITEQKQSWSKTSFCFDMYLGTGRKTLLGFFFFFKTDLPLRPGHRSVNNVNESTDTSCHGSCLRYLRFLRSYTYLPIYLGRVAISQLQRVLGRQDQWRVIWNELYMLFRRKHYTLLSNRLLWVDAACKLPFSLWFIFSSVTLHTCLIHLLTE